MANLITIDQLLESVDLEFEPRWVTKNDGGCVFFWGNKPKQVDGWYWEADGESNHLSISIKLAEFDGKDWTECIYQVPRKTTGKITGLGKIELSASNMSTNQAAVELIVGRLNQVIDAVNELKGGEEWKKLVISADNQ